MKKLLSIVLAVALMSVLAFSASAAETVSLFPASVDDFTLGNGGDGTVTVTKEGDSLVFTADKGWPDASYMGPEDSWVRVNVEDDLYLNYDFEVQSGATNIIVYFCGQNPADQASLGSYVSLNGIVDPSLVDKLGNISDLGVGHYTGSVKVGDLGCREDLQVDGDFLISGMKVFAVGGTTVVNELSVGPKANDEVENNTDTTTTTAKKPATDSNENPKTGDASNAVTFAVVAMAAAAVVTVSVVSKKAKSR